MEYKAHPTAVIDEGCEIGRGTSIWHFSHIMPGCKIGENCNIGQNVVVSPGVALGSNVKVQNNVSIYTGVICEDDVFLGPSMVFTNVINPRSAVNRKDQYLKTIVRKGATIGANATIVCGHNIGAYAFIGAGAPLGRVGAFGPVGFVTSSFILRMRSSSLSFLIFDARASFSSSVILLMRSRLSCI